MQLPLQVGAPVAVSLIEKMGKLRAKADLAIFEASMELARAIAAREPSPRQMLEIGSALIDEAIELNGVASVLEQMGRSFRQEAVGMAGLPIGEADDPEEELEA